jgi:hypothetical protein
MNLIKLHNENGVPLWVNAALIATIEPSATGSCIRLAVPGRIVADCGVTDVDLFREWVREAPAVIAALLSPTTTFREAARRLEEAVAAS